jgi:hypothetical protein
MRVDFPWRPCLIVFAIALAVRVFFLLRLPHEVFVPNGNWELDAIAISLVEKGRFADAYVIPTGPTAHLPPIPPLLVAVFYKMFGLTALAGVLAWVLRILIQSAIWGLLPWIGQRTGLGWQAGLVGGLAAAFFPQWMGHGEAPAALLFGLLVVGLVRRWDSIVLSRPARRVEPAPPAESAPKLMPSLFLGAGFGVLFHAQPVFLLVFLGYLTFELWRRSGRRRWASAGYVLLGALLVSVPWGVRNARAFDGLFFVRSNFGLELHIGNHDGAQANIDHPHYEFYGTPRDWSHPRLDVEDAIEVRDSGEVAYMRRKGSQAATWIASNPGEFARLTAQRIRHFWLGPLDHPLTGLLFSALTGLAALGAVVVARRLPATHSAALLIPLLTYPLVYYLVPWQHRYRFPIDWILFLLAGAALWSWVGIRGRERPAGG